MKNDKWQMKNENAYPPSAIRHLPFAIGYSLSAMR
jgi:hypothetical protein